MATNKGGRPSLYSQEIVEAICERLIEGESLRAICRDEAMPASSTVIRWLATIPEFQAQYTRAKEEQAETFADEIVGISDESAVAVKGEGEDTVIALDPTAVARNRLRVDARKWVASKLKPKKYGDKLHSEVSGPDGGPIETRDLSKLSDEDLEARLAKLRGNS